ncbi:MAG: NDP-sugar synthase [Chloroflexi bacterium]|nr:NDP-sugar synthase [Chloroflexota bacterium]
MRSVESAPAAYPTPLRRALLLMDGLERPRLPVQPDFHPAFRLVRGLPIADHLVRHLAAQGVTEIGMTVHQLPGLVVHYFADGAAWGVRIHYVYEQRPLGGGGALAQAAEFCTETTLVLAGSTVMDIPLASLAAAHRARGALVTAVLGSLRGGRPRPRVELDSDGQLVRYIPAGTGGETSLEGLVDTGVYLIEPGLLGRLSRDSFLDWTRDILLPLVQERQVCGYQTEGLVLQVSTPEDLQLAEESLGS